MIRRADDNPETLRKRLATYHKQTTPLVDFYRQRRLLRTVDASLDSTTIYENITKLFEDMKSMLLLNNSPSMNKYRFKYNFRIQ